MYVTYYLHPPRRDPFTEMTETDIALEWQHGRVISINQAISNYENSVPAGLVLALLRRGVRTRSIRTIKFMNVRLFDRAEACKFIDLYAPAYRDEPQ